MRKAAFAAVLLVASVYLLRLDRVAGLIVDDGWYAVLGRSIAQGTGYQLANAPSPGLLPPDPPGFALLLAPIFWIAPHFPDNVLLLKSLSLLAMLGAVALLYVQARGRHDWTAELAQLVAIAFALVPAFVWLATSTLMSECVFTCSQLGAIALIGRRRGTWGTASAGLVSGLTVLIRTAGIGLPVGAAVYFLASRQWRRLAIFSGTVAIVAVPWLVYSRVHEPTMAQRLEHGGAHAFTYGSEFWMRWAGDPSTGTITYRGLPARVMGNVVDIAGRDIAGIVAPGLFRGADESGQEVIALGGGWVPASMGSAPGTMVVSVMLSVIVLLGFVASWRAGPSVVEFVVPVSLGVVALWPQWSYRFVLPLAPFLLMYLVDGLRMLFARERWLRVSALALLVVIGLSLLDHGQYIVRAWTAEPDWIADAHDVDDLVGWMQQHVSDRDIVATTNPPLIYLRTGHPTIASDDYAEQWTAWTGRGVRYLVSLRPSQLPPSRFRYDLLFRTPRRGYWIVRMR